VVIVRQKSPVLAALLVWVFFLWRALDAFGPGSDINNVSFNSDSAIPVLMANDARPITVFNGYYYAADRWGAWPLILAQSINRTVGVHWTPERLTAFQIVWVFLGAWAFASLDSRAPMTAGIVYLLAICLHREGRYLLFELSQLYAWQTTALLLAWASLRRLFDRRIETSPRSGRGWPAWWLLLMLGASLLATWSSVASTGLLSFVLAVEMLRAYAQTRGSGRRWRWVRPAVWGFSAIAAASVLERLLKMRYHRYSLEHYGTPFLTVFHLDTGYLAVNLRTHLHHLARLSWWPLYLLPMVVLVGLGVARVYAVVTTGASRRARVGDACAGDTVILAIGAYGIAAVNFVLAVLVDHVRLNGYDDRYLTLTNVFAPVSGMVTLSLLLTWTVRSSRARAYLQPAVVVGAVVLLAIRMPVARHSPEYELLQRTASMLAMKAPGAVLMGSYWDTYVFTALQPRDALMAVPFEGDVLRTPWTLQALAQAHEVIVAHARGAPPRDVVPAETLQQYGYRLRLVEPYWYGNEGYTFASYVVDHSAAPADGR
jgi:hypothetical protein